MSVPILFLCISFVAADGLCYLLFPKTLEEKKLKRPAFLRLFTYGLGRKPTIFDILQLSSGVKGSEIDTVSLSSPALPSRAPYSGRGRPCPHPPSWQAAF